MSSINDVSFYNIIGEEVSREILVQKMVDYYSQKLEVGETKVTDFNEGSEIRNLLESFAVDIYSLMEDQYELSQIAFISTAYGEWLDLHGQNPLINCPRNLGSEAVGYVTFSIPDITTGNVVIPEGTIVSNEDGLEFSTDMEAYIVAGDTSVDVMCTCLTVGADGNVAPNSITIVDEDMLDDSISVNNLEMFTGGEDYEDDDVYRERMLSTIRESSFGSLPYYNNLALSIEDVHDVSFIDYTDPNSNIKYTKKVLVNGFDKPVSDEVLLEVLKLFTDTNNIVLNHNFVVDRPNYQNVNLTINLEVEIEIEENIVRQVILKFFNGGTTDEYLEFEGLSINEDLSKRALYSALEQIDYVVKVEVINNDTGEEVEDITPNLNEVLVINDIIVNQVEVV